MSPDLIQYYEKKGLIKPRAAILVHKGLEKQCNELTQFTTPDQIAIEIKHENQTFIIASTYMDITLDIPPAQTSPLIQYAQKRNIPLITCSDTNSRHTLWGDKICNSRGEQLLDFLNGVDLTWANKGSTPTFANSRGQESLIDITITNNKGFDLIDNWKVDLTH